MNNLIFITIILFFMYLFYHSYFLTYKENFDKRKQIISSWRQYIREFKLC